MTELVRHDALQLIARELFDAAAGYADHGRRGREPGGKRIDRRLVHQEHGRHGDPRCDGHLCDHVQDLALLRVMGMRIHRPTAQHTCDRFAARGELRDFEDGPQKHDGQRTPDHTERQKRIPELRDVGFATGLGAHPQKGRRKGQVDPHNNQGHGDDVVADQQRRLTTGDILAFKEVHRSRTRD